MSQPSIIPSETPQPPEHATKIAVTNIITSIREAIEEESKDLAGEWAEASGTEMNIFMQDRAAEILAQMLAGFIERANPRASQFTDAHASAFLGIPPAGNPVEG